jgi:hypothetical protein
MDKPKTFWTQISEWFDRDKYLFSSLTIFAGLFFFYHQYTRDTLKSDKDLLQVNGIVKDYSFADKKEPRRTVHEYYIWLDNYASTFQIQADFLDIFNRVDFEKEVNKGDSISLTISKQRTDYLSDPEENIFVFSLAKKSRNYLDKSLTLKMENSGFDIYAGIFFIVIGIGFYVFKRW